MGFTLLSYFILGVTGIGMLSLRRRGHPRPQWLKPLHYIIGGILVTLVLVLLGVGIIGTLGHYGSLGHSIHLVAGLTVVGLVLFSGAIALQISPQRPWARPVHVGTNILLLVGCLWVLLTGWDVVQKYLPK
jgi:hypothetical protein